MLINLKTKKTTSKMINFILSSSLIWLIFYISYKLFLERDSFFQFHRFFLLSGLFIGLLLPSLNWLFPETDLQISTVLPSLSIKDTWINEQVQTVSNHLSYTYIFLIIYLSGLFYYTLLLIKECLEIRKIHQSANRIETHNNYSIVYTELEHPPFTFGQYIYINNSSDWTGNEESLILIHEQIHAQQKHTWDNLFIESIRIIFWFNPLLFFIQKELKNTHEYIADRAVLKYTNRKTYGQLLINNSINYSALSIANHFIYSQLKKRINMMTKPPSSGQARWKYALMLPLLFVLTFQLSAQKKNNNVHTEVDQMPTFPDCAAGDKGCSQSKMFTFIGQNMKYPEAAANAGTQGTAYVEFTIDKKGKLIDANLKRDLANGCGAEALRVVQEMAKAGTWTPGKKDGKAVSVKMVLPLKFKLATDK